MNPQVVESQQTNRSNIIMPIGVPSRVNIFIKQGQGVLAVNENETVLRASKQMRYHHVGCLLVTDDNSAAVGMITERDLVNKVLAETKDPTEVVVKEIMTTELVSIDEHTSITTAQAIMAANNIRHLPIIEDGMLLGLISSRDILAYQCAEAKDIVRQQIAILNDFNSKFPDMPASSTNDPATTNQGKRPINNE